MNAAHLHLVLNHFPLIGLFVALLIFGFGFLRKDETHLRVGLFIIILSGLLAIPVFLTGEPAEEVIEHMPSFSEELVEEHEEAAGFAIWLVEATAVTALAGFYFSIKRGKLPRPLFYGIAALGLFTFAALARTNSLGGKISHPELREVTSEKRPSQQ